MVFLDASSIVAIMTSETGFDALAKRIGRGGEFRTSALAIYEATLAVARISDGDIRQALTDVRAFLKGGAISVVPIHEDHSAGALDAFAMFGKPHHAAKLNMGDCFSYALTKSLNASILFVGHDFSQTDLQNALLD